jgi:hypothetical protein
MRWFSMRLFQSRIFEGIPTTQPTPSKTGRGLPRSIGGEFMAIKLGDALRWDKGMA